MNHFLPAKYSYFPTVRLAIAFFVFFQWIGIGSITGQETVVVSYDDKEITIENSTNTVIFLFGGETFDEKAFKESIKDITSRFKIDSYPSLWCGIKDESIRIPRRRKVTVKNTNCAPVNDVLKLYALKETKASDVAFRLTEIKNILFKEAEPVKVNEPVLPKIQEDKLNANKAGEAEKQKKETESLQKVEKATQTLPAESQFQEKRVPAAKEKKREQKEKNQTENLPEPLNLPEEAEVSLEEDTVPALVNEEIPDPDKQHGGITNFITSYISLFVIGLLLILMITGIIFYINTYFKNKKIKKESLEKKAQKESGLILEDDDEEIISYTVNIADIRARAGVDYYEIDMRSIVDDTAIQSVYLSRKCILDIYKFFSGFLKLDKKTEETGCFLIGRWDYADAGRQTYNISLEFIVMPSDDAVYEEYELNFGAKIGIGIQCEINRLREETGKEYVHTAWMHSHPGLGLFLSNQDLTAQSQLAYSQHPNRMLAIVIDSNTENLETAFFTPKRNGEMNNKQEVKQTLSLDTLYQWAKRRPASSINDIVDSKVNKQEGYYDIQIQGMKSKIRTVFFSGSAIIDMDAEIDPGQAGVQGYFPYRENYADRSVFIDEFQTEERADFSRPLGCLFTTQHFSYNEVLTYNQSILSRFDFFVIYCSETEDIYIVFKELNGKYPERDSGIASSSLLEMKKWTRRRRE